MRTGKKFISKIILRLLFHNSILLKWTLGVVDSGEDMNLWNMLLKQGVMYHRTGNIKCQLCKILQKHSNYFLKKVFVYSKQTWFLSGKNAWTPWNDPSFSHDPHNSLKAEETCELETCGYTKPTPPRSLIDKIMGRNKKPKKIFF